MKTVTEEKPATVRYRLEPGLPVTPKQLDNLEQLAARPAREIDTSDAPELPQEAWSHAMRGQFYRLGKQARSLRLGANVTAWLRKDGAGYQTQGKPGFAGTTLEELRGRSVSGD